MPLFAKLFTSIAAGLVSLFSTFLGYKVALKLAAYTTWIAVFTAFLVSVFVCVSSLLGMVTSTVGSTAGGSWMPYFWMGLGMFIPSNASAIMACLASVWISTSIYKVQKEGIMNFGS